MSGTDTNDWYRNHTVKNIRQNRLESHENKISLRFHYDNTIVKGKYGTEVWGMKYEECADSYIIGQRPLIIVPRNPHCNLHQNNTHSYTSQLIVDPTH